MNHGERSPMIQTCVLPCPERDDPLLCSDPLQHSLRLPLRSRDFSLVLTITISNIERVLKREQLG